MKTHLHGLLGVLGLLVFVIVGQADEYGTWTSRKGTSVDARFSRVSGNYVILQKTDGRFVKIERSALSDVDQALLRQSSEPNRSIQSTRQSRTRRANPRPRLPVQQSDRWDHDAHDSQNQMDEWRQRQEQAERWRKQEEQERVQREKEMIKSRAFQLEGRIRDSRHSSHADYGGMSTEADFLSQDASRLGESGAAWQFGNAASKLREMEREDNSLWNRQQDSFGSHDSIGSQFDNNRREAERDVWGGSGSINSFDSGSSMDSW